MKTLDRNRPVGHISGHFEKFPGAKFEQDGLYFHANGELCEGQDEATSAATSASESSVDEIREWVDSQKGAKGRKALEKYAATAGIDPKGMKIGELRDAIVEKAEELEADG